MRTTLKKRKNAFILSIFAILMISIFTFSDEIMLLVEAHNSIPYSIDWTNTNLITVDNTWGVSDELGVRGYAGADTPIVPGTDARTFLTESLILDVDANETNPDTLVEGGVAEFEIANPTIALKASDTAHAPYINLLMDSRNLTNIRVRANVRDIDSTANDAVQQVAVQFRFTPDETGPYTDVPSAYIADATQGGTATRVTPIDVTLPPLANGHIALEIRIMTVNAVGNDEWIGIDDIFVTGVPALEGDIASRSGGDGSILSNDIVQVRRFLNGTHTPDPLLNEFQRADSFPFADKGDGVLNSADVVQTRRYQNGTSPLQTVGGPLQPGGGNPSLTDEVEKSETASKSVEENLRGLRIESTSSSPDNQVTVNIRVNSPGGEAEYGFILSYDQTKLSKPVIEAGTAGASVRSCNTKVGGQINCSVGGFPNNNPNSSDAGIGEIAAGNNQILITITFTVAAKTPSGATTLALSNINAASDAPQLFTPTATKGMVTIFAKTTVARFSAE